MKTLKKSILLLTSFVVAMSAASCVNNELTEPEEGKAVKELATIDEQVASMEATVADLEALQTSAEGLEDELAGVVSSLESHIADLKAGAPLLEGTLATLAQQKKLAELIGTIEAGAEPTKSAALTKAVASIDKGAGIWLGKHFDSYYPAVKAEATAKARIASFDFRSQKILVEGVLSDVDAGLRKEFDAKELAALASGIDGNAEEAEKLSGALSALTAEVEAGYTKAVETAVEDPADFDLPAPRQLNSSVAKTLAATDNSLAGLIARVEACETQLEEIKSRLGELETEIKDLQELLGMIQSVTFMSEYSAEKAVAYYTLGTTSSREDGKKTRTPQETMELTFVVRPASASAALAEESLWDEDVKVFGYYAQTITKAALDMFDFNITNVEADESGSGIVTVSVESSVLDEAFWFKEKGAKLALSIATGKTDLTTKFVEIVPKDASGTVYVEDLKLEATGLETTSEGYYVEIPKGESLKINGIVSPSDATVKDLTWAPLNVDIASVSAEGVVEAKSVGTAQITVTTKGTDEWGMTLSRTCSVKVIPNTKIVGPGYVEKGKTIELRIESTEYIDLSEITWTSSSPTLASVDDGVVTGLAHYYADKEYKPIEISCKLSDGTELSHTLYLVALQPEGISVPDVSGDTYKMKIGDAKSFAATMSPDEVDENLFKLVYQSGFREVATIDFNTGDLVAKGAGTANITISVQPKDGTNDYSYPKGSSFARNISVVVEPYWVTGMTLMESGEAIDLEEYFDLSEGATSKISIAFTSDKDGVDPSDMTVEWTTSDESVVSVAQDGTITAKEGSAGKTAQITVKTNGANSVPAGTSQISATFTVSVSKPWISFNVGDYVVRNQDGTISFSSDANVDGTSTITGIVIAKTNPRATDTGLPESCVHGLAIGLGESSKVTWWNGYPEQGDGIIQKLDTYATQNGYSSTLYTNADNAIGFNNTSAFKDYMSLIDDKGWQTTKFNFESFSNDYVDIDSPLLDALNNYSTTVKPSETSDWYLPSFYEMQLIYEQVLNNDLNGRISSVGESQIITNELYWSINDVSAGIFAAYNPTTGETKNYNGADYSYKLRFVFAF